MLGNVDMVFWPLKEKLAMRVLILSALLCVTHAFSAGNMASLAYSRGQLLTVSSSARAPPSVSIRMEAQDLGETIKKVATSAALGALLLVAPALPVQAENAQENFKVLRGASSTQDSGSRRTITRGTVLDNSNFAKQNLKGVSFQQSLCRSCDFKGAKLVGASFFDGDLSNANMEGADVSNVNFEMTCMKDANLKNAVVKNAYILATTKLDGLDIEGADFTDTFLRKDQQRYLCGRASGTNPKTGVDTAESLMCDQVK